MYQLTTGTSIIRLSDGATIPDNPGNRDYSEYLAWLEAGKTPEPAPAPSPSPPNYVTFWDALISSSVYNSIRSQSMASLPMNTLATEFFSLIGDAKAGRPNEAAIRDNISSMFTTGTFTSADTAEFIDALEAGRLGGVYPLGEL